MYTEQVVAAVVTTDDVYEKNNTSAASNNSNTIHGVKLVQCRRRTVETVYSAAVVRTGEAKCAIRRVSQVLQLLQRAESGWQLPDNQVVAQITAEQNQT